jgi:hypothetical protein
MAEVQVSARRGARARVEHEKKKQEAAEKFDECRAKTHKR